MEETKYADDYILENNKDDGYDYFLDHGKESINTLLWTFLPENITLGEADKLASNIYNTIHELWERQI